MMGYLASVGKIDSKTLRKALAYGTVVASFNVQGFSLTSFQRISRTDIDARFEEFETMMRF